MMHFSSFEEDFFSLNFPLFFQNMKQEEMLQAVTLQFLHFITMGTRFLARCKLLHECCVKVFCVHHHHHHHDFIKVSITFVNNAIVLPLFLMPAIASKS